MALYTFCNVERADGSERRGAYYPFCEYSPEWVAIREGRSVGADIRFIDLDFDRQICVDQSDRLRGRLVSLLAEKHFERSAYLRRLAAHRGCRNHDELWDRLFEVWGTRITTEEFIAQVFAYCDLSRRGVSDAEHQHDATSAREAEMAWHIKDTLDQARRGPGRPRILVVSGGYHTVTLPALVARDAQRPEIDTSSIDDCGTVMIRYSFDRLDRLRGYCAGMPSPAFYQRLWDDSADCAGRTHPDSSLDFIAEIASRARDKGLDQAPTAATLIAAHEQVHHLARLRGNPCPTRDDLLDAIGSCFIKGTVEAEGRSILRLAADVLTGAVIGQVPAEAGQPPIVSDFFAQSRKLRLNVEDSNVRNLVLETYRECRDRDVSRFLHTLQFLEVPFGSRLAGPQFTSMRVGRRLHEQWEYGWSPQTETGLIDAASYGSSIQEAAANKFLQAIRQLSDENSGRSAANAVEWLSRACLLGLHGLTQRILGWMRTCVREDPSLTSVAGGLTGLLRLWDSRDPLGAKGLEPLPELARTTFERAVYLALESPSCADTEAGTVAGALVEVRACLAGSYSDWFTGELFWDVIRRLTVTQPCNPTIGGAAAGLLYAAGLWTDEDVSRSLHGHLRGGLGPRTTIAFFRGLVLAARDVLWQSRTVLATLREVVESADEPGFLRLLPELRLALALLTPRETDQLAEGLAAASGIDSLPTSVSYDLNQAEVQRNLEVSQKLREVLERDSLSEWSD